MLKKPKILSASSLSYYLCALIPMSLGLVALVLLNRSTDFLVLLYNPWYFWTLVPVALLTSYYLYFSFHGILRYGNPEQHCQRLLSKLAQNGWDKDKRLIVSYVTKGLQPETIKNAVAVTSEVLSRWSVNAVIEVISDEYIELNTCQIAVELVLVPESYVSPYASKAKARALQFAIERRAQREATLERAWVLHMDEESVLTDSAVAGISDFLSKANSKQTIAQGEIHYNAARYCSKPLITALDSIRTGHDLGFFRAQYKLFKGPLFGAHGSFLLVPATIEATLGMDYGPSASLTEDAFFCLNAFQKGYCFTWIEGVVREQSPLTLSDLFKQRRRWINGLMMLASDSRIKLVLRLVLMFSLLCWRVSLGLLTVLLLINFAFFAQDMWTPLIVLLILCWTLLAPVYLVGALRNIQATNWYSLKKFAWLTTVFFATPVCALIETIALLFAIFIPRRDFYVIAKSPIIIENASSLSVASVSPPPII